MSDEGLLLPKPPEPERTQPAAHPQEQKRATLALRISRIAAFFACLAALGSIWQAAEVRKSRQIAEQALAEVDRPFLEIENWKMEPTDKSNIQFHIKNIGRTPARRVSNNWSTRRGTEEYDSNLIPPLRLRVLYEEPGGTMFHPDMPVGKDILTTASAFIISRVKQIAQPYTVDDNTVVRLTGVFKYSSVRNTPYNLPWCYEALGYYKSDGPSWSECLNE